MKLDYLNITGKSKVFFIGFILLALIGSIDFITGVEISFSVFYLIPISIVTWYSNKNLGLILSVLGTAMWVIADIQDLSRYASPAIPYWNGLVRFSFFTIIVLLIHEIKAFKDNLEEKVKEKTADLLKEINERKKTTDELKNKTEQLSELTKRLQNVREEENARIAREIHDELGQSLTAIKMELMWICKKNSNNPKLVQSLLLISETVDDTIKNVRKISANLRPKLLDQLGFLPAIEWQVKEFSKRTKIKCDLDINGTIELNPFASSALFRIFQESLTNVARHSEASRVKLSLEVKDNNSLEIKIKDNGIGISNGFNSKKTSLGILGMKERAQSLGGILSVAEAPDGGTEVSVRIPINEHLKYD
ncbi:MAG: sensor histidine kinase [Chlorobi bacterium]|nr:sensor histidine kinase [Chlorobiota bacterium]MCI0715447.1 sensor histidine kinase [Chlorobiota bacterium]